MKTIALSRRGLVAGLAATPLVAIPAKVASAVSDEEARFLALIPWLKTAIPELEAAQQRSTDLFNEGYDVAGDRPDSSLGHPAFAAWYDRAQAKRQANGYHDAWHAVEAIEAPVVEATEPFMDTPMTSLQGVAWKARVGLALGWDEASLLAGVAALAGREGTLCA